MIAVSRPHIAHVWSWQRTTFSTRGRFSGNRSRPGCGLRSRRGVLAIGSRCALGFHLVCRRPGLFVDQQLQLQIAQCFAVRSQQTNPLLAQPLFQHLDFQLRPMQFALQLCDAELGIGGAHGEVLS